MLLTARHGHQVPSAGVPRTVELVRSGDRPFGDTAATDQSSAAAGVTGHLEDIDAGESATAVQPTAGAAGGPPGDIPGENGADRAEDAPGRAEDAPGQAEEDASRASNGAGPADDASGHAEDGTHRGQAGAGPETAGDGQERGGNGLEPGQGDAAPTVSAAGTMTSAPVRRRPRHRAGPLAAPSWLRSGLAGVRRPLLSEGQRRRYAAAAGPAFARATVLPAILVMAWLLVGLPLLLARSFLPAPMLLIAVPVAIALATGLRQVPSAWPRAMPWAAAQAAEASPEARVAEDFTEVPAAEDFTEAPAAGDFAEAPAAGASPEARVAEDFTEAPAEDFTEAPVAGASPEAPVAEASPRARAAAVSPGARPAGGAARRAPGWSAWWGLAGTVAVAAGFALWQFLFNSESVIVLRDPGAYLQTGYWIAQHGSLPIPQSLADFGGAHSGLGFSSTGFFAQGASVVPGLMSGLPLLLAGAFWVHGTSAAAAMGPILGGLAVLAFGGLVGRLTGPQWAPAGALVLGLTLPEQYTSRASFSETVAQVLLFGGLSLVADALTLGYSRERSGWPPAWRRRGAGGWAGWLTWRARDRHADAQRALFALGGLALGLSALVRFDGLLDVLPAIPFVGILVVRRSPAAAPFAAGLAIGAGYGLADAYLLARPFVDSLQPLPELIGLIAAWLAALTLAGVELLRLPGFRRGLGRLLARRPARWLPEAGAVLAVAALIGLAIRPYLQTVRGPASQGGYVAVLQRLEHLPVDPGRLYAEDTLYWVIWYIGLPAVLLGGFGAALLVRRCLQALLSWHDPSRAARNWALPLAVIGVGSAAVLWQPETVPDQPWASRRLVPLVLPGLILCALWAAAWLRDRARSRGAGRPAAAVVAVFCVGALLVPTVATTFGLGLSHSGPNGGLRLSADGMALKRTGQGEVGAVDGLCSAIGPGASVVIVDRVVAARFTQVIRGMCGVPVAWMAGQPFGSVQDVLGGIERAGRRPVVLGSRPAQLGPYGGSPVRVLNLFTLQDPHTLTQPPTAPWPIHYVIWMTSPGSLGTRV